MPCGAVAVSSARGFSRSPAPPESHRVLVRGSSELDSEDELSLSLSHAVVARSSWGVRRVAAAAVLATVLALGALSFSPREAKVAKLEHIAEQDESSTATSKHVEEKPRRLIDSPDFTDLCIEHAMQMRLSAQEEAEPAELAEPARRLAELSDQDRYLLEDGARHHFRALLAQLSERDPEAARFIEEATPSKEQWNQVRTLMRALSDPRIRKLGSEAMLAANSTSNPEEREKLIGEHLEKHSQEMRQLREELFPTIETPPSVEGRPHWKMMVSAAGLGASGDLLGWHAKLVVGQPMQAAERMLRSLNKGRRLNFGVVVANLVLWIPLGIAVLLPVLTLVMTLVTGPLQARIWASVQGAVAGLTCAYATALQSALQGSGPINFWPLWVPCGFNVALFGLESVWTVRKAA